MLGEKLKNLRIDRGLMQREVAAALEVDAAYISKMESNDKPVSHQHLKKLSRMLCVSEQELLTWWLADRMYDVVKDEKLALQAIRIVEKKI